MRGFVINRRNNVQYIVLSVWKIDSFHNEHIRRNSICVVGGLPTLFLGNHILELDDRAALEIFQGDY